jgi:hypothetical protein
MGRPEARQGQQVGEPYVSAGCAWGNVPPIECLRHHEALGMDECPVSGSGRWRHACTLLCEQRVKNSVISAWSEAPPAHSRPQRPVGSITPRAREGQTAP